MKNENLLLDTCFIIRLLNPSDVHHSEIKKYYEHFLINGCKLFLSTISIAEYCVKGSIEDIPFQNIEIVPFNSNHSVAAGKFAEIIYRNKGTLGITDRKIISNDTKLFSQASVESRIKFFVTTDQNSEKMYKCISSELSPNFSFYGVNEPLHVRTGQLF